MQNIKYYNDVKKFSQQFAGGYDLAKDIIIKGNFENIIICGVGGSALFGELLNNYFAGFTPLRIYVNRSYTLPNFANEKTLFLIASHSGNTEETISCLNEVVKKNYTYCILTSGGKLLEHAKINKTPLLLLPTGIQPRLTTGYFITGILKILSNANLIVDTEAEVIKAAEHINESLDELKTKTIAKELKGKVPIIYSTDNNSSIAMISKIKFNENTKTQAFWNFFPEVNHNEMVGFTNLVMNPFFLIYKSKFTTDRNHKRIEVFTSIMRNKGISVEVIDMIGNNLISEILNAYYFIDHVTLYLAEEYGVDPEPVELVEKFKKMI